MINALKLRGRIVEKGMTISGLAEEIGMNRSTFYRKLDENNGHFTVHEADLIIKSLHLSSDDATAIFFSQFVA